MGIYQTWHMYTTKYMYVYIYTRKWPAMHVKFSSMSHMGLLGVIEIREEQKLFHPI